MAENNTAPASVDGTWSVTIHGPTGPQETKLELSTADGVLGGVQSAMGQIEKILDITYDNKTGDIMWINKVKKPLPLTLEFRGSAEGVTMSGKVKAGLIEDPVTKAGQINVETYRGVVQLGGFVDTAAAKERATTVARSVTGVKEVRNDLEVSSPQATAGQVIDDSTVTASVKTKLVDDSTTKAHQINVETFKGTVQLSGFVETDEARTRALQLARDVEGVRKVKDAMEVRRGS